MQEQKLWCGFVAGFTTVDHAPTLVIGRRKYWEMPAGAAPDILAEGVALLVAERLTRSLGPSLFGFLTRVFGLLLAAIAVQLVVDGVRSLT